MTLFSSSKSASAWTDALKSNSNKQRQCFERWMADYAAFIRHIIAGFEASKAIQDELFQDISLAIWQAIPRYQQQAQVKTFIARICHNRLATHVSKAVRQPKGDPLTSEHHELACTAASPYQQLASDQRQQKLTAAVQQLPIEQRQVITLALEGMSYQEIADALDIRSNLVGVRLNRAKTALQTILGS